MHVWMEGTIGNSKVAKAMIIAKIDARSQGNWGVQGCTAFRKLIIA